MDSNRPHMIDIEKIRRTQRLAQSARARKARERAERETDEDLAWYRAPVQSSAW